MTQRSSLVASAGVTAVSPLTGQLAGSAYAGRMRPNTTPLVVVGPDPAAVTTIGQQDEPAAIGYAIDSAPLCGDRPQFGSTGTLNADSGRNRR